MSHTPPCHRVSCFFAHFIPFTVPSCVTWSWDADYICGSCGSSNPLFQYLHSVVMKNDKTFLFSVALDTVLHGPRLASHRRHSVSVCQTPTASQPPPLPQCPRVQKMISVTSRDSDGSLEDDEDSQPSSIGSASPRRSLTSGLSSPEAELDLGVYSLNASAMHANLHTEFIHSVSRDGRETLSDNPNFFSKLLQSFEKINPFIPQPEATLLRGLEWLLCVHRSLIYWMSKLIKRTVTKSRHAGSRAHKIITSHQTNVLIWTIWVLGATRISKQRLCFLHPWKQMPRVRGGEWEGGADNKQSVSYRISTLFPPSRLEQFVL